MTPFAKWRWHLYHLVLHDHKYKYHGHKATVQNAEGTQWIFNYWLDEKTIDDGHPPFLRGNADSDFKIRVVFNPTVILGQSVIISWHREQRHICFFAHCYFHCCLFFATFCLNFNTSYKTCGLNSCVQHILSYPVYNHWMYLAQILFCVWNLTLSVILFISMCHSGGRIDGHYCLGTSHNIKRIPTTTGICMQTVVISICIWQPRPLAFVIWRTYNTLPLATWPDR